MESNDFEKYNTVQYCFPSQNSSCTKEIRSTSVSVVLYVLFSIISILTVFLNLLVIISISHFKQLHTPTNLLILSLAVADLMVGAIVMPMESIRLIETCWYFGEIFCALYPVIVYIVVSASLGNLVFISVDRYIAISDPLRYTVRVTFRKTLCCIGICWSSSLTYAVVLLFDHLSEPMAHVACYGDCIVVTEFSVMIADLIITFLTPCTVIIILYFKVFKLARKQMNIINEMSAGLKHSEKAVLPKKSERKAAKTLGVLIVVYLICWIPYYICILTVDNITTSSAIVNILSWFMYINSCLNPVIYALFYPWFKTSVKYILTLRIIKSSSSSFINLFSDNG
ncbi:trace amine-associated receptor 13c-like [Chanos chanos]|uniref:Trace amine-associated receptor 13c-like n=1 Tax=Chanos chanos TaxID=29144 RepID=A0A6J2WUX2_CHACN|nr:trace amine-associated receptor 13c-like [Chanos chanos]